jgi:dCTP deaminase
MWVPAGVAVYGRAIDETIGEMRIHYAGFVHPFFGTKRQDGRIGTPLIFEVRGHDVNVVLKHGEKMAGLIFYRMSEDAKEKTKEETRKKPTFMNQDLTLSNYFAKWPEELSSNADGTVFPTRGVVSEPTTVPEARL